jgi:tetratricopeptide (TPR) repeat protein
MHACPSCSAPLDPDGICAACGSLARGFFLDLDLGPPQVAAAVAQGLDFYRLLDVTPADDLYTIARRYRRLRVLFPDDARQLAPEPARKLQLLEIAGRVLTHAELRQMYDRLRKQDSAHPRLSTVRCAGCGAPLQRAGARCRYCGMARPPGEQAPDRLPEGGAPAAEPVDYYAALGLTAEHLLQPGTAAPHASYVSQAPQRGPAPHDVDEAANLRQQVILMAVGLDPAERERRLDEIEIARRLLRDERRRDVYDALLLCFSQGRLDAGRLDALRALQDGVLAELREERGLVGDTAALVRQARGLLGTGLAREALALLRRVIAAGAATVDAHSALIEAVRRSGDPLALASQPVQLVLDSFEALERMGALPPGAQHERLFWRGLLARQHGDLAQARQLLSEAAMTGGGGADAWRARAAIELGAGACQAAIEDCRRALALAPGDEPALLLLAAACARAGKLAQARDAAAQVARLRGSHRTGDVLEELGLA